MTTDFSSPIRSILHPTDFSPLSQRAFDHALALAIRARARLTIAHVTGEKAGARQWAEFPAVRGTLERWRLLEPGSRRQDVAATLGIEIAKINIVHRSPLRPIASLIDSCQADLVVLATHGREGLPRWLHGAVAEPLARSNRQRTLFLPPEGWDFVAHDTGKMRLRRLLLPVDHTPSTDNALALVGQFAGWLPEQQSLQVDLLHVGGGAMPELRLPSLAAVDWRPEQVAGTPVAQIVERATARAADLIVMPTAGHQGFLDALRGSTTEQTLRRAPCPLLAVPSHD